MDWWAIIATPDGRHAYQLGDLQGSDLDGRLADIRAELGVPDDILTQEVPGYEISLTQGEPHPSLLAACTVHRLGDQ